jgi:hypothetical protein
MAKYEVWGRQAIGQSKRNRLASGFSTEAEARKVLTKLKAQGFSDAVVVQRPPQFG